MPHPEIQNDSPFACEALFLADEEGYPLLVPVIKGTYRLDISDTIILAEEQLAVKIAGESYGDAGHSSYRYEPETAFVKLSTDVVLIGHAYPPYRGAVEFGVRLCVGALQKIVTVVGDRKWVQSFGTTKMTRPEPVDRVPLIYERAFGGWDRSDPDSSKHSFEPRNPVGVGFRTKRGRFDDSTLVPNLEDPHHRLERYGDTPPPAGFGFISPNWQPRAAFVGTYDDAWTRDRSPLLPKDFDRKFFTAASPGLVTEGFLQGGELVTVENASRRGRLRFELPERASPVCEVRRRGHNRQRLAMHLDTVIINTDEDLLLLIWRGCLAARNGPHDIVSIQIHSEDVGVPVTAG